MSRGYMVFDRSGCSERIILFHVRDFSVSAFEIDGFWHEGNGFKETMALGLGALENAKLSRVLSIPLLAEEEEFSWGSSSSEVAAPSMADEQQQQQLEMADDEESNCYSGESGDEVDALLNLEDYKLVDTADSMEVPDHRSQRIEERFMMLRNLVGGDWMDTVDVLDEAIRRVKRLQMDFKNLNDSCDI